MADIVDRDPGHACRESRRQPTDWLAIEWKQVRRNVRNLRFQIFRAAKEQNLDKVKYLSRKLLKSRSNLLLAIRQVTEVNAGRKTPGIDGELIDTPEKKGQLADELRSSRSWSPKPVRRVYIPKANGKMRPLGIPTVRDRVMQAVVKNVLEPRFEAEFEAQSYGFRPGRCCQDAIEEVFNALRNGVGGHNQWVLDADIKGAFDHIGHDFVLDRIGDSPGRPKVKAWLNAGYVEWGTLHQTTEGTPQGGVVSPVLANIALDGLRVHLGEGYRFCRYADDFLVMAKSHEAIEEAIPKVVAFLKERGLKLNWEKTRVVHKTEGFNFLGFNVRDYKGKLLIKPQKEKVLTLLRRIKAWLSENKTATAESVIRYLDPVLRGWFNYYRFVCSKDTFRKVDHLIWKMLWTWAKRRHPNKGTRWIASRYFVIHDRWKLYADTENRRGEPTRLHLMKLSEPPILRHRKVKGTASPDDPELVQYWEERSIRYGRSRLAKESKLYKAAERQGWKCLECGEFLFDGQSVNIHHAKPVRIGGLENTGNLVWLHEVCHQERHRKQRNASSQSA